MIKPGLLAVIMPILVGVSFRIFGVATGQVNLGAQAVAGKIGEPNICNCILALSFFLKKIMN